MAPKPAILVIAGIGAALGLGLIICASVVLSDDVFSANACKLIGWTPIDQLVLDELCKFQNFWKGATSLGIIAGIFQIFSIGAAFLDKSKIWSAVSLFVALLCAIAFGLAVDKEAFDSVIGDYSKKFQAFAIISILDGVFAVIGAIGVFALSK